MTNGDALAPQSGLPVARGGVGVSVFTRTPHCKHGRALPPHDPGRRPVVHTRPTSSATHRSTPPAATTCSTRTAQHLTRRKIAVIRPGRALAAVAAGLGDVASPLICAQHTRKRGEKPLAHLHTITHNCATSDDTWSAAKQSPLRSPPRRSRAACISR
jgi:hypothetical protein